VLAAVAIGPLFADPWAISLNDDWTWILAAQAYLRDTFIEHGALAHRSHMLGSGFPIAGHPEYPILSPLSLPVLLFGPVLGLKIAVWLVCALGALGTWLLCRRTLGLSAGSAAYATAALTFCGWLPAILHSGNYPQIYYLWTGLLAYLVFERRVVLAGLLVATMLTDGHLNSVCVFLVVGAWACLRGREGAISYVLSMATGAGLGAFKLLPTLALLRIEDRTAGAYEIASPSLEHFISLQGPVDAFALGPIPWLLMLGAAVAWRKATVPAALLLVAIGLYLGWGTALTSRLPILRSIDAPSKYYVYFIGFFAVLLGAIALERLPERVGWALGAVVAGLLLWANAETLIQTFTVEDPPRHKRAYVQIETDYFDSGTAGQGGEWTGPRESRPDLYLYYLRGVGIARWEDNFRLPGVAVPQSVVELNGTLTANPAYRGEAWSDRGSINRGSINSGAATLDAIHANGLTLTASLTSAGQVHVNQRWDTGWTCSQGDLSDSDGRLSIALPAGDHAIRCRYRSMPLTWGLGITGLTALLLAGLALRRARIGFRRPGGPFPPSPA
jgi:hypothetical protein